MENNPTPSVPGETTPPSSVTVSTGSHAPADSHDGVPVARPSDSEGASLPLPEGPFPSRHLRDHLPGPGTHKIHVICYGDTLPRFPSLPRRPAQLPLSPRVTQPFLHQSHPWSQRLPPPAVTMDTTRFPSYPPSPQRPTASLPLSSP